MGAFALAAQLRLNGIDDVRKVKVAHLESEGSVSVIERIDADDLLARFERAVGELRAVREQLARAGRAN